LKTESRSAAAEDRKHHAAIDPAEMTEIVQTNRYW